MLAKNAQNKLTKYKEKGWRQARRKRSSRATMGAHAIFVPKNMLGRRTGWGIRHRKQWKKRAEGADLWEKNKVLRDRMADLQSYKQDFKMLTKNIN